MLKDLILQFFYTLLFCFLHFQHKRGYLKGFYKKTYWDSIMTLQVSFALLEELAM